jgi:cobalamin biosynthesis Mg chelatase CobN
MGPFISNNVNVNTDITNTILQNTTQVCNATQVANASGNTIIISGTVNGNVGITTTSSASASCALTNASDATVKSIVANLIQQNITAATDMGDLSFSTLSNNTNINTAISNYITQITTQTCNAVSVSSNTDEFFYVQSGGVVNGNLYITAQGNANASCAMSNISKISAYNNAQNSVTQSATSVGMFALIAIAIIVIVLVGGLLFVMMMARGSFGGAVSNDPLVNGTFDPNTVNRLLNQRGGRGYARYARAAL